MATVQTTTIDELLKRVYASWEIEQLVNVTYPVLADAARKGSAQLGGSGFFFPVRTKSAEGHAYISEADDLPKGGQSNVLQAQVDPTVHAGVVEVTGLAASVSSTNVMAFARAFDENVQQTIETMSAYKEGAFFRDGVGLLATITDSSPGGETTVSVDDVGFLREGMQVDVIDATGGSPTRHNLDLEVETVDWPNRTVTFSSALASAVATNDRIFLADSQSDSGTLVTKEPLGLEASLLATGTYLGIDRSQESNWRASVIPANDFLDEDLLLRARTRITQESGIPIQGQAGRFRLLTHPQQTDVLFKLAIPRIRYAGGGQFDLGNADDLSFGNIRTMTSYLCPVDKAYLGDWMYSQSLYTPNGELHVDTEYNGSALKWVNTKDVGLVFLKEYHQFVVRRPNAFVRFTDLSTPVR